MPTDKSRFSLILRHASQLVCVSSNGALLKRGASMNDVCVIEDGALVVALDGRIAFVGPTRVLDQTHPFNDRAAFEAETEVNAAGKAVVPGLVDGHSHPVWAGNRVHEFAEKLSGASYLEIHGRGGGIQLTVRETRNRSAEELLAGLKQRLDRMLRLGTTLLEAKSGYGLDLESEVKLLKVLRKADEEHHVDIVGNYCGAHSVPVGVDKAKYVEEVVSTHMPEIQRLTKLGEISPELIDVGSLFFFCFSRVLENPGDLMFSVCVCFAVGILRKWSL